MAQGRSTKIITMIKWIRTSRLSIKKSLSRNVGVGLEALRHALTAADLDEFEDAAYAVIQSTESSYLL